MSRVRRWLTPRTVVHAHCDIPCGVYDPQQARIEAESCYKIIQKYNDSQDELFRTRSGTRGVGWVSAWMRPPAVVEAVGVAEVGCPLRH